MRDGGGPSEAALQEEASNCSKAAVVKSHGGERLEKRCPERHQV